MFIRTPVLCGLALHGLAATAQAQCTGTPVVLSHGSPYPRRFHQMTYDSIRHRVILYGRPITDGIPDEVWEWNGSWIRVPCTRVPNLNPAMAFDQARGRTVLFSNSTYLWDGTAWMLAPTPVSPGNRLRTAMAYDQARQRVVLFGGVMDGMLPADTWTWDGVQWTRAVVQGPPGMSGHAMAYDPIRQMVILAGGSQQNNTWAWDGTAWRQPLAVPTPSLAEPTMAYVAKIGAVVQMGRISPTTDSFLSYDDFGWVVLPRPPIPARAGFKISYDEARGELILFGGFNHAHPQIPPYFDTWCWNASSWRRHDVIEHRDGESVAYDEARGRLLVGGGRLTSDYSPLRDTWTWDGERWTRYDDPDAPGVPRATVFDRARGRVVQLIRPTRIREWDGMQWQTRVVSGPEIYPEFGVAYDTRRRHVVLFGGFSAEFSYLGETWTWDGQAWTRLATEGPRPREPGGMAYDEERDRVVMWGGADAENEYRDTWEWDGSSWEQRSPASPERLGALVYDNRRRVVSSFSASYESDTLRLWSWSGSEWLASPGSLAYRSGFATSYDGRRDLPIVFGGYTRLTIPVNSIEGLRAPGPTVVRDPGSLSIPAGTNADFALEAAGSSLVYRWRRNRQPIYDGPAPGGGTISGSGTASLLISAVQFPDAGEYDCIIVDSCGQAYTDSVWLRVTAGCYANCDGSTAVPLLNVSDLVCFLSAFVVGDPYADCDQNSVLNVADFICFHSSFIGGCP